MFIRSVRISKKIQDSTIKERLMLLTEITVLYSENRKEPIHKFCEWNADFFAVKVCGGKHIFSIGL